MKNIAWPAVRTSLQPRLPSLALTGNSPCRFAIAYAQKDPGLPKDQGRISPCYHRCLSVPHDADLMEYGKLPILLRCNGRAHRGLSAPDKAKSAALLQDHLRRGFHASSQQSKLSVISVRAYSSLLCMCVFYSLSVSYRIKKSLSRDVSQNAGYYYSYFGRAAEGTPGSLCLSGQGALSLRDGNSGTKLALAKDRLLLEQSNTSLFHQMTETD